MRLTPAHVRAAARDLNVEPAALYAVVLVESAGRTGTMIDGELEPLIRWEGHYCYRLAKKKGQDILNRFMRARLAASKAQAIRNPKGQAGRYSMLDKGRLIDDEVAISSCSWGLGQVMGSHWKWLGYRSAVVFMEIARSGIEGQVDLMARYIAKAGLADELRARDWAGFARGYNGPNYAKFKYDTKMANAYAKASGARTLEKNDNRVYTLRQGVAGEDVAAWQRMLVQYGYKLNVDGDYGPSSKAVTMAFQKEVGIKADGLAGPATRKAMDEWIKKDGKSKTRGTPRPPHTDTPAEPEPGFWALALDLLKTVIKGMQ